MPISGCYVSREDYGDFKTRTNSAGENTVSGTICFKTTSRTAAWVKTLRRGSIPNCAIWRYVLSIFHIIIQPQKPKFRSKFISIYMFIQVPPKFRSFHLLLKSHQKGKIKLVLAVVVCCAKSKGRGYQVWEGSVAFLVREAKEGPMESEEAGDMSRAL